MKARYFIQVFLIITLVITFTACNTDSDTVYDNVEQMVKEAEIHVDKISPSDLILKMEDGILYQIIDCREPEHYIAGHIPGAVNVPRGKLEFSTNASNRRLKTFIFSYGNGSGILAAETMRKLRFFDLHLIDCNWEKWIAEHPDMMEEGAGTAAPAAPADSGGGGCGE